MRADADREQQALDDHGEIAGSRAILLGTIPSITPEAAGRLADAWTR